MILLCISVHLVDQGERLLLFHVVGVFEAIREGELDLLIILIFSLCACSAICFFVLLYFIDYHYFFFSDFGPNSTLDVSVCLC